MLPVSALVKGSGPAGVWTLNAKGSGLVFTPVQVVSMADAIAGKRVVLEIVPVPPADGVYKPGNYFGNVNMIFNAVMPGG